MEKGEYAPFYIPEKCSGTAGMTTIKALKGTHPIIKVPTGSASKETIGIEIENASNICISGLTISGGTQGIYYESNSKAKSKKLNRIIISNCQVKNVKGVHGIAIWATNDKVPVTGLVIENCKVHHCLCGDSESVVVNGNIDGFVIRGNTIHDNIIRECKGFAGLTFGGYDASRGYTIGCHFYRNTLMNNPVQIAVQRSKNNRIYENTIIGGEIMVEYSEEIPKSEMKNYFFKNKVK